MEEVKVSDLGFSKRPTRSDVWWGVLLLGSPTAFLLVLTARYALRDPACQYVGAHIAMEICGALAVLIAGATSFITWRRWRADGLEWPNDGPERPERVRFVAVVCFTLATFELAAAIALWAPSLFLSPCLTQ